MPRVISLAKSIPIVLIPSVVGYVKTTKWATQNYSVSTRTMTKKTSYQFSYDRQLDALHSRHTLINSKLIYNLCVARQHGGIGGIGNRLAVFRWSSMLVKEEGCQQSASCPRILLFG